MDRLLFAASSDRNHPLAKSSRASSSHFRAKDYSVLFWSTAIFIIVWMLGGGGIPQTLLPFDLFALTGSWLLGFTLATGGWTAWRKLSITAKAAITFFCCMPLVQCIPLPSGIWHAFPGRGLTVETLGLIGEANAWRPLTLTFEPTFRTLLFSIWLLGLLLAVLRLSAQEVKAVFILLLGLGALDIAIGMLQIGSRGHFQFYDVGAGNFLLGFFANKNHSGLFIACLFPIGYVALYGKEGWSRARLPMVAAAALVLFAALILTFSRAGFGFGVLAFVILLAANRRRGTSAARTGWISLAAGLAAVALLLILSSSHIATQSFDRFSGIPDDPRWLIWSHSWHLVRIYFPIGSGIGSFPEVFEVLERLAWVHSTYTNHAHNEYLEQVIEVGIAAPILWGLVIAMLARPVRVAWRDRFRSEGRTAFAGAIIILLALVHSFFDYPLRRPGMETVFIIALAVLLRPYAVRKKIA